MENTIEILKIKQEKIEILNSMNIKTIEQLINYFPSRYQIIEETGLVDQEKCTIEGILAAMPKVFYHGKMSRMTMVLMYHDIELKVTVFNRHFIRSKMQVGMILTIIGKYDKNTNSIVASDIKLTPIKEQKKITPIYNLKDGITTRMFQGYVKKALLKSTLDEQLPRHIIEKYRLCSYKQAILELHNPSSSESIKQSMRYIKYYEFFTFQLTMQYSKRYINKAVGVEKCFLDSEVNQFICQLPYPLTHDQETCVQEILNDMKSKLTMFRFVQGDVGSGKTVVAVIAMYANKLAGYQSAFMAPTEVLAKQHYNSLTSTLRDSCNVGLLVGSMSIKQKQEIYDQIRDGKIDIIVGTHALFQEKVIYNNLGLVITDEQHRFGVNQRKALKNKGEHVDFLIMSATPIPRTLAISMFGDMDVSTIETMPKGRKGCITKVVKGSSVKNILPAMQSYLQTGGQIYVVCPLVEKSETIISRDASSIYQGMKQYFEPEYNVGLLHGQMLEKQKDTIMQEFKNNDIKILISTTVIEVGVDVANANMMIIYNAERFGLSQLHQLRGRVGRSDKQGYCYLISNMATVEAKERLTFLETTTNGFEVSKYDLAMRGPGDVLGNRQSGDAVFVFGDMYKDFAILQAAKNDVEELFKENSKDDRFVELLKKIKEQLKKNNEYID